MSGCAEAWGSRRPSRRYRSDSVSCRSLTAQEGTSRQVACRVVDDRRVPPVPEHPAGFVAPSSIHDLDIALRFPTHGSAESRPPRHRPCSGSTSRCRSCPAMKATKADRVSVRTMRARRRRRRFRPRGQMFAPRCQPPRGSFATTQLQCCAALAQRVGSKLRYLVAPVATKSRSETSAGIAQRRFGAACGEPSTATTTT